ncbi:MAG TPA: BamA/TamA family outer membrane protein [Polyangiaceae bacterium]|nr:BamA/TamA family outer membrane protein [Polyangiaceae bacterium]
MRRHPIATSGRTCSLGHPLASVLGIVMWSALAPAAATAEPKAVNAETASQKPEPARPGNDAPEPKPEGWGVTGYPIIYYSPETKAALGGGLVLYHNSPGLRPDVTELELMATQKHQLELNLEQTTYFRGNDFVLWTRGEARRAPDTAFFGVGADTPSSQKETYLHKTLSLSTSFLARTLGDIYLGPALSLAGFQAEDVAASGQLAKKTLTGARREQTIGAGAALRWDTTDSAFYPTRGFQVRASGLLLRKELGSHHNFAQVSLDHRQYIKLLDEHVLALQFIATTTSGDVPWQKLPLLGGMRMLRGYYEGRYRDRIYAAAQAEYRFPIYWRFGGAAFVAAGEVARSFGRLSVDALRAAAGGGLRFILDSDEHINLRVDFAATREGNTEFYISLLEAF